jgi:hypothetical protein
MESGTSGARLEDTRSHSPARRSPHLALISVRTVKRAAGIITASEALAKNNQDHRNRCHSRQGRDLKGILVTVIDANLMAAVRRKKREKEPEQKEEEELGKRGRRGVIFLLFSTPAMRAKRRQPGVSSPNQSPAPQSRRPQAACVCPEWVSLLGQDPSLSLHTLRVSQIFADEPRDLAMSVLLSSAKVSFRCNVQPLFNCGSWQCVPESCQEALTRLRRISCLRVPTQICYAISGPSR